MRVLMALVALALPSVALAQTPSQSKKQPVTTIVFEESTETGLRRVPGGIIVEADPAVRHASLLKVRSSFAERVLDSSKELR